MKRSFVLKRDGSAYNRHSERDILIDLFVVFGYTFVMLLSFMFTQLHLMWSFLGMALSIGGAVAYKRSFSNTIINVKSLFCISWIGVSSLSLLRLHPKQVPWSLQTVLCLALSVPFFLVGCNMGRRILGVKSTTSSTGVKPAQTNNGDFRSERLVLTGLGFAIVTSFAVECIIVGYIPILSANMSAYKNFAVSYIHYLTVLSGIYPSLVYCAVKQYGVRIKHYRLLFMLTFAITLIPLLIVSRQLVILEFSSLIIVWYIGNDKMRLLTPSRVFLVIIFLISIWALVGTFRNQSSVYLIAALELPIPNESPSYAVSLWQLYMYTAFNFDNLNHLINHWTDYLFGLRALYPFITFIAAKGLLPSSIFSLSAFQILPLFTTFPMISTGYVDFGILGGVFWLLIGGAIFSFTERRAKLYRSPSCTVSHALSLYCVAIIFFTDELTTPVYWVYIGVLAIYSSLINMMNRRTNNCIMDES